VQQRDKEKGDTRRIGAEMYGQSEKLHDPRATLFLFSFLLFKLQKNVDNVEQVCEGQHKIAMLSSSSKNKTCQ
jgi:hypothetical protein